MITTHVLDTALGKPGKNIPVTLFQKSGDNWTVVGQGVTDADGRLKTLTEKAALEKGAYRLDFAAGEYLMGTHKASFYDTISIVFKVENPEQHFHVPLLVSPFGYSTYRGS